MTADAAQQTAAALEAVKEGSAVKVDRKQYTVARVGKECKLEHKDGTVIWRHARTVARLQAPKKEAVASK